MIQLTTPFTLILLLNSAITITLIFTQNESAKDSTTNQNSSSLNSSSFLSNPLENITWICFLLQLLLLLLKTKIIDF